MTAAKSKKRITLSNAEWLRGPVLRKLFEILGGDEGETRAVGGAVRDAILGRPVGEIDLATIHDPETVMARARKGGLKVVPTGIDHGTVTVTSGRSSYEVTTLRVDIKSHGRRADVAFTADWQADARRRDFTMNALYANSDGTIFDPVGGYEDIRAGRVRFIGDADARIAEDYLRILRFFRFHAHYGSGAPDAQALAACVRGRDGLAKLSAERIGHEILRLLAAPEPSGALWAMYDNGLLALVLGGVPNVQLVQKLLKIERLCAAAPDQLVRLGVLACMVEEDAERLVLRLRLSGKQKKRLIAAAAFRTFPAPDDEPALKEALYRLGGDSYHDQLLMAWSRQFRSGRDKAWRMACELPRRWPVPALPWSGADVVALGIAPGTAVGNILKTAESAWISQGFSNSASSQARIIDKAVKDWKARHRG